MPLVFFKDFKENLAASKHTTQKHRKKKKREKQLKRQGHWYIHKFDPYSSK